METCSISSIEEFKQFLNHRKPQRACCVYDRGFDKTAAVEHAAKYLETRCGRARIVCPNDAIADLIRKRMGECAEIVTARSFAMDIITDERVQTAIGRHARLIDANEMDVLMEDLKVTGLKHRRLREMLKFFFKSLSDGTAREIGWLVTGEEQRQFAVLEENLEARGALLPYEVACKALEGIEAVPDAAQATPSVIVDFGALSTLSQQLVLATCEDSFIAFGSESGAPFADEPYPHYEGLRELAARDDVIRVDLELGNVLPGETRVVAPSPIDEFACASERVAELVNAGADPSDILVATPVSTWSRQIARALEQRGIACRIDGGSEKAKGDPRQDGSYADIEAATLAKLRADRTDMTALRTWLGLGDWLLRSDAFLELLAWARDHDMSAADAIAYLYENPVEASETRLFHKFVARLDALEDALAAGNADTVDGDAVIEPSAADHAVTVAPFDRCPGRIAEHVFVTGLVNGFLPHLDAVDDDHTIEQKLRACARDRELFCDLKAIARTTLTLSRFEHDAAANAERLPMEVARIYQSGGTRMVRVNASLFLEDQK